MTLTNDRETNQTDKQINRQTQREKESPKDKKKDRQTDKMLKVGPRTRYHTNDRLDKKSDDVSSIKLFFRS